MERDFKNLNKIQEVQYNAILDDNKEKSIRLRPIKDNLKDYYIYEIWELDGYQVAKIRSRSNEIYYAAFVNYKSLSEWSSTFDHAVLVCLAYKHEGHTDSAMYAAKVLGVDQVLPEKAE